TVSGGPTPDTIYTRDNEQIYVLPGVMIFVDGIFLSQVAAGPVTFESGSLAPLPGDWGGFEFSAGSIGRFDNTQIRHARTGMWITDADVTLRNTLLELCYPNTVYFEGGLLHVNNSIILGSAPPVTAGTKNGGGGMYITGGIADTLWINQSTVTGGNALGGGGGGSGGYAIFTINVMGPMGLIGNDLIQGGNGGFNNFDGMSAGGGGLAFYAFPVWDMGPMPSINISGNTFIKGGNGGLNNASLDGDSGWGSQGIIISDDDYTGTVVIANNMEIYGGDGGDNFADWNVGFTVGNGGPGIVLDNVGGMPTRIRNNGRIFGGKGGNNTGASMMGGAIAGMGGRGVNLGDTRNVVIAGNAIIGGHGGNNTLTGIGVIAGSGGNGLFSSISQNLTLSGSWIYGGEGGDDYAGLGPGMMNGPGVGAEAIRSNDNWGNVVGCFAEGGKGGDNFGQMGEGRFGGAAVLIEGTMSPTFNLGAFIGGRGGDNYNDSGIAAGQGNYAFLISGSQRVNIWNSDISGGDGGDAFQGANALPGNGMSGVAIISAAWAVNIADNPMITVGQGGTNFITGAMGVVGSFGIEAEASTSGISILRNYITGASFSGVYSASPGILIDGNTIESNWMGVYLEPTANWANITNNPKIGGGFLGISTVQPDNLLIRNNKIESTDVGIAIAGSQNVLIDRTWVLNATTWAMSFQTYADKILVENSTITGSMTWDFSMHLWSNATTLNTAFDATLVDVLPNTRLTVKNYLDVKVLDQALTPLSNADVEVLDNAAQIYATPGFGGGDATTDPAGEVNWIVVTDRIYWGNPMPIENVTDAQVAEGVRTFINNPRGVDMSTSHQEVFLELGADVLPPEIWAVLVNSVKFLDVPPGTPVDVTATLVDFPTGGSNITSANYTVGMANWPGTPMNALLPPFDFPLEDVIQTIDTTGWTVGSYDIWVYGCDEYNNCNLTGDFATLNITAVIDNEPPEIRNVLVDGMSVVNVLAGTVVTVTADIV
ncbi:MAG: right-handed parallel beta-helix repeat-containing protein, partial [Thermoplasmata archaeon]|nr:right-handed parallel beta-helix repeat-containing protein [Thermoplasmata archaeon]